MLTFELGLGAGSAILIGGGALGGSARRRVADQPRPFLRRASPGAVAVLIAGVFQELIQLMLQHTKDRSATFRDSLYTWDGLSPQGAVTIFLSWRRRRSLRLHPSAARAARSTRTTTGANA